MRTPVGSNPLETFTKFESNMNCVLFLLQYCFVNHKTLNKSNHHRRDLMKIGEVMQNLKIPKKEVFPFFPILSFLNFF
ncbi:unnamed protein product [Meloidogyne enterolobii]|uniref:Uncharacterized protein n=1 Tax=Meloidogyne enterolobii TaxID=390850 RepID=A0ACB0Z6D4_MELEN